MKEGKALIYVIADTFWLNPSDLHHIYLNDKYVGSNREAHYCPIYADPGKVIIKSTAHNTDTLELNVDAGSYYVIVQKRISALSSAIGTKLEFKGKNLKQFDVPIYGKCVQVYSRGS